MSINQKAISEGPIRELEELFGITSPIANIQNISEVFGRRPIADDIASSDKIHNDALSMLFATLKLT